MKEYISVLRQTALFAGMDDSEIEAAAARLNMRALTYERGETVCHSGQFIRAIGILAAGRLMIQKDDYWGNRSVVNRIGEGEVFGEAFAMQEEEAFFHDVIALDDSVESALVYYPASGGVGQQQRGVSVFKDWIADKVPCAVRQGDVDTDHIHVMKKLLQEAVGHKTV